MEDPKKQISPDKPLSPVLSTSRKIILLNKKLQKKSRIKLTERFKENCVKSKTQPQKILSTSGDRTEIVEPESSNSSKAQEVTFKIPTSPSCHLKCNTKNEGFQTAGGNAIELNIHKLQNCKTIFDDILNPNDSHTYSNKFSFISKSDKSNVKDQSSLKVTQSKTKDDNGESENFIDNNILSTQETNELFSEFELTEQKDNLTDCCKGFDSPNINESKLVFNSFNNHLETIRNKSEDSIKFDSEEGNQDKRLIQHRSHDELVDETDKKDHSCPPTFKFEEQTLFTNKNKIDLNIGFSTSSGKKILLSEGSLNKARAKFNDNDFKVEMAVQNSCYKAKNGSNKVEEIGNKENATDIQKEKFIDLPKSSIGKDDSVIEFSRVFSDGTLPKYGKGLTGFSTASGKNFEISNTLLEQAKHKFNTENEFMTKTRENNCSNIMPSTSTLPEVNLLHKTSKIDNRKYSTHSIKADTNILAQNKKRVVDDNSTENSSKRFKSTIDSSFGDDESLSTLNISSNSTQKFGKKKRLGISSCKPIPCSKEKLERAARFFDDDIMSPVRKNCAVYSSTPIRDSTLQMESELTPIKPLIVAKSKLDCTIRNLDNERFLIRECTTGTIDNWNKDLENEKINLQAKLRAIIERQEELHYQKSRINNVDPNYMKRRNGILFEKKLKSKKVLLKNFLKSNNSSTNLDITPQNAELVHFNCVDENVSCVCTLDGARIVPNINNLIGLTEIESAFQVMQGVEAKLIPIGWIRNHFKWIVWKLASYENFASNMKNCLTVENVVQQLKYRYDREIDRAQRSTLRKIYELDDVPQKRMVLCVSNITNLGHQRFEMELTDGWYCIKTAIDEAICLQISKRKIQIGTKLIICGAELLNCEGSHPLEATDVMRLKIHCNSTRRARWFVKLGYQHYPEPFPINLISIYSNGGLISCTRILIARVYPIKYMERQNNLVVWRNARAEEIRAREWETNSRKSIDHVHKTIMKDYESTILHPKVKVMSLMDEEIKSVSCPETLYNLFHSSKDPEHFQALLTQSQKDAISKYQQRIIFMQREKLSQKLSTSVSKRDVTCMLQLRIVDSTCSQKSSILQIWKPTDVHLNIKESEIYNLYNVNTKKNGDLSTISRTKFKLIEEKSPLFSQYSRRVIKIIDINKKNQKLLFNEFDTTAIVVLKTIETYSQTLWLTDETGSLLFVKIFESFKNCLLLDTIKIGDFIAISNLILCKSNVEFAEAIANHSTVISMNPKAEHLQEALVHLTEKVSTENKMLLEECNKKISYFIDKVDISKGFPSSKSLIKAGTSIDSDVFDETSDDLYSMIDVDKLVTQ